MGFCSRGGRAEDLHVDLLVKRMDNSVRLYKAGVDKIDYQIPEKHTRHDLMAMLGINDGATPCLS